MHSEICFIFSLSINNVDKYASNIGAKALVIILIPLYDAVVYVVYVVMLSAILTPPPIHLYLGVVGFQPQAWNISIFGVEGF